MKQPKGRKAEPKKKNCVEQEIEGKSKTPRALKQSLAALTHNLLKGTRQGWLLLNCRRSGSVKQDVTGSHQAALLLAGLLYLEGRVQHIKPKIPF